MLFLALTASHGIPGLRHDWSWISDRAGFISSALATLAWRPDGVGSPRPYPTDYLLALADAAIVAVVGVKALFFIFIFGLAATCVFGARHLAASLGAPAIGRFGVSLFALYNPWVYTEFVAGHLGMIIAYGATLAYAGESLRAKPRPLVAALLICVSAAQLQLLLVLTACAFFQTIAGRGRLPLATGLVVLAPTLVGILGNRSTLAAIPFNLTWQSVQSVRPVEAAALTGYFANYVAGFSPIAFDAVWAMLALAAIGLIGGGRKIGSVFLLFGLVAWAWSTGVDGPIAALYSVAVVGIPQLAIFRELYDLLAYVAIAYIALASLAAAKQRIFAFATVLPGAVLFITWCLVPPARWFVALSDLPAVSISAPAQTRVALMPDVQPLTFEGRGSGLDPDAYPRTNGVFTLNGLDAAYPSNVSMRRFALTGDVRALEALGVSRVVTRPWLATDVRSASAISALSGPVAAPRRSESTPLEPVPELSLFPELRIVTLPPPIGSAEIFFGDGAGLAGRDVPKEWREFQRPALAFASRSAVRARDEWVDVRLAFLARPELGQGLGGVITTSKKADLTVISGQNALVWVRGRLLDQASHTVVRTTLGYRWIALGQGVRRVRCDGECVVVAQGAVPLGIASRAPQFALRGVEFYAPAPWLAIADVPPQEKIGLLRYAVGYETNWRAFTLSGLLTHVRIETALNGWIVPPQARPERVVIVECVAAIQTIFEVVATGWTLVLVFAQLARCLRPAAR